MEVFCFEACFTYNSVKASMLLSSGGISPVMFLRDKFLVQVIAISKNMYYFNFKKTIYHGKMLCCYVNNRSVNKKV